MYAEMINDKFHYFGEGYEFTLTDEKYHRYATLIVKPRHIDLLYNDTDMSDAELTEKIVEGWFGLENEATRLANNKKRRNKNV